MIYLEKKIKFNKIKKKKMQLNLSIDYSIYF